MTNTDNGLKRIGAFATQMVLLGSLLCVSCGEEEGGDSSTSSGDSNSCDVPTVSGELVTDVGAIQFPDTIAGGMVTRKDGLTSVTVQAYFQDAPQCFVMVSSVYGDFPTESLAVATIEFRGLECENVDPTLNDIFQLASDTPASKLTIDLKQNTEYEDIFGQGGQCWTGTVQVTFADFIDKVGLPQGEGLNLSGTMTFSGSFLRLFNH